MTSNIVITAFGTYAPHHSLATHH